MEKILSNLRAARFAINIGDFRKYNLYSFKMDSNLDTFIDYVLTAIKSIRKNKLRPDNYTIFDYVIKNCATDVDPSIIDQVIQNLLNQDLIENRPTAKGDSYFIKSNNNDTDTVTFTDNIDDKRDTEKIPQSTQTKASMNYSYVSNEVFDTFYEDYIEFKNYMDDIINDLNAKCTLNEKKQNDNNQSKVQFLEAEILNLKKENESLKDDNKSKLKIIASLTTTQQNQSNLVKRNTNYSLPASQKQPSPNQHKQITPDNNWQTVKQRSFDRFRPQNKENYNFESSNVFSPLYIEDQNENVDFSVNVQPQNNHQIYKSNFTQNHVQSRRPDVCITEKYVQNFSPPTIPGNSSYATRTKFGKKIFVVGDSHVKRMKRIDFNKQLRSGKAFFKTFSGANTKQLSHYIIPSLVDDKPDTVIIHVGTNDVLNGANDTELANSIIKIGMICKQHGVNDVFISSILVKKSPRLNALVRKVNDQLRDLCVSNGFQFISNDMISTDYLWRDGIHLQDAGTDILSSNFCKILNEILFSDHP